MLESYSALQLALSAGIVFAAFVVRGLSGFGAGMFGIPLLAFLMPVHTAVSMFGLLVLSLFVFLSVRDWSQVVQAELRRLLLPTLLGVAAGILLFTRLDNRVLLQMLGGFLIAYAIYALAVHHFGLPGLRCSPRWATPVAFAGGLIDTLFGGGGGTLVVIYLHLRGVERAGFRATVAVLWLCEMIARIIGYGTAGYYTAEALALCAVLMPAMAAGTWAGERLGNRISQEAFARVLAGLLMLTGVSLLVK